MSPHAVDDDRRGRAQQQGGHDDNGGQDDEDNDPDIQDVLGEHDFHGDLADGVHAASLCNRRERGNHCCVPAPRLLSWKETYSGSESEAHQLCGLQSSSINNNTGLIYQGLPTCQVVC